MPIIAHVEELHEGVKLQTAENGEKTPDHYAFGLLKDGHSFEFIGDSKSKVSAIRIHYHQHHQ